MFKVITTELLFYYLFITRIFLRTFSPFWPSHSQNKHLLYAEHVGVEYYRTEPAKYCVFLYITPGRNVDMDHNLQLCTSLVLVYDFFSFCYERKSNKLVLALNKKILVIIQF